MSEYWVSKKKYFCKYCEIYIADDAPSRQLHENGLRHKGNVERFIRGIYKTGEKQKKDREEEQREMKRVEQAAAAAYAQDISAGIAKPSGPVGSSSTTAKKPLPKPSSPYANYSTAASLGYTDPDADRLAEETTIRHTQGVAGAWQMVSTQQSAPLSSSSLAQQSDTTTGTVTTANVNEIGVKREAEGPPAEEDLRAFKLRKKQLIAGLGEIYDPGLIPIKVKKEELSLPSLTTEGKPGDNDVVTTKEEDNLESTTSNPSSKWAKAKWSAPIPDMPQADPTSMFGLKPQEPDERTPSDGKGEIRSEQPEVKVEIPRDALSNDGGDMGGIKFKKRKAPVNAGRGRREI